MTPYFGAGAGQAIEVLRVIIRETASSSCTKDAFVLGRLLANSLTTLDTVTVALKVYQDVRLPSAQSVARESERRGHMLNFNTPDYHDGTDRGNEREEMNILKEKIICQFNLQGVGSAVAE